MNLGKIREHIDHIDLEIIKLLNERMELGLRAKKFKNTIYEAERESQVLERLKKFSQSQNVIREDFVKNLFTEIIQET
jgi:chorismate mutase